MQQAWEEWVEAGSQGANGATSCRRGASVMVVLGVGMGVGFVVGW